MTINWKEVKHEVTGLLIVGAVVFGIIQLVMYQKRKAMDATGYPYNKFKAVIASMGTSSGITPDKFRHPVLINTALFHITDPRYASNLYFALKAVPASGVANAGDVAFDYEVLTDPWMYNHRVGDTVWFDFIRPNRVFTISR